MPKPNAPIAIATGSYPRGWPACRLRGPSTEPLRTGSYIYDHRRVGVTAHYRIERGWADPPGTDRRRQVWVLSLVDHGRADILSDHASLADARGEIERRLALPEPGRGH